VHCPACNRDRHLAVGIRNGFELRRCQDCELVFVSPIPPKQELDAFYQEYHKTSQYSAKLDSKLRRAKRRIRRLKRITPGRQFIDVGCNVGFAVEAARLLGFEASGIDLDRAAIEHATSLFPGGAFHACSIQELAQTGRQYDLVYCSEVIEHLPRLDDFLAALSDLLVSGGVLFLTTPDMGHFSLPRDRLSWDNVRPPEHLLYFSRKSLRPLLEKHGFRQVRFSFNLKPTLKVTARKA